MNTIRTISALALWLTFIAVHLVLGLLNLRGPGLPLGDVTIVYAGWAEQAYASGVIVGVDLPWVYPLLAQVPILASVAFGLEHIGATWLVMVMLVNLLALGFLTRWGRSRSGVFAGWWWALFVLLLGPVALARIDAITVALAIMGVRLLRTHPQTAGIVLACATWVKVWPAALLLATLIAVRDRGKIGVAAAATSATVVAFALLAGAGWNVFSFIAQQTSRGIQIEAPIAGIWLWQIVAGAPNTFIFYDNAIVTFQVAGVGVDAAAAVLTPALVVVVGVVAVLGVRAVRAGVAASSILPMLSLALVSTLIVVNKVGSPQFISWLAVPIVLGLMTRGVRQAPSFRIPAVLSLIIAALTQIIYPYLYDLLLVAHPAMIILLSVRNVLLIVLLGWAVTGLARLTVQRTVGVSVPTRSAAEFFSAPVSPTTKESA